MLKFENFKILDCKFSAGKKIIYSGKYNYIMRNDDSKLGVLSPNGKSLIDTYTYNKLSEAIIIIEKLENNE